MTMTDKDPRSLNGAEIGDSLIYRKTFNTSKNRNLTLGKEYPIIDVADKSFSIQIRDDKGTCRWIMQMNWHRTWELKKKP